MTLPNFLIIGSARSGTTSLYHYLREHPDVFMSPVKEANFFSYEKEKEDLPRQFGRDPFPARTLDEYRALFKGRLREKAIGEASPLYLFAANVPERIRELIPDVKLVAIFRNPIERAHSAYRLQITRGCEERTFDQAIRDEVLGRDHITGRRYKFPGPCHRHISSYLEVFERSQMALFLYDDLVTDPGTLVRTLFEFLEVDAEFRLYVDIRYNSSNLPKQKVLRGLFRPSALKSAIKTALPRWVLRPVYSVAERLQGRSELDDMPPILEETNRRLSTRIATTSRGFKRSWTAICRIGSTRLCQRRSRHFPSLERFPYNLG